MSSIDAMRSEASTSLRGRAAAVGPFFAPGILCSWALHRKTKYSWGALDLGQPRTRSKLFRGVVGVVRSRYQADTASSGYIWRQILMQASPHPTTYFLTANQEPHSNAARSRTDRVQRRRLPGLAKCTPLHRIHWVHLYDIDKSGLLQLQENKRVGWYLISRAVKKLKYGENTHEESELKKK